MHFRMLPARRRNMTSLFTGARMTSVNETVGLGSRKGLTAESRIETLGMNSTDESSLDSTMDCTDVNDRIVNCDDHVNLKKSTFSREKEDASSTMDSSFQDGAAFVESKGAEKNDSRAVNEDIIGAVGKVVRAQDDLSPVRTMLSPIEERPTEALISSKLSLQKQSRRRRVVLPTRSKTTSQEQVFDGEHLKGAQDLPLSQAEVSNSLRDEQREAATSLLLMMHQCQQYDLANTHLKVMKDQEDKSMRKKANLVVASLLQQDQQSRKEEKMEDEIEQSFAEAQRRKEVWVVESQMRKKDDVSSSAEVAEVARSMMQQSTMDLSKHFTGSEHARWVMRVQEVKDFVKENGHGRIPTQYKPNPALANWCKRQRYHYKVYLKNLKEYTIHGKEGKRVRCHMTPERAKMLNDAGFCWDLQAGGWDHSYEQLKKCTSPPNRYTNYELWKWVGTQRYQMSLLKRGKTTYLNPERIRKLNAIGFVWSDSADEISGR